MPDIHTDSIVFDGHMDTLSLYLDRLDREEELDFTAGVPDLHVDYPRSMKGGLTGALFAAFVASPFSYDSLLKRVLRIAHLADSIAEKSGGKIVIGKSVEDILNAKKNGKLAMVLSIENSASLEGAVESVAGLYKVGYRVLGLVWNGRNALGDGIMVRNGGGLTQFGIDCVKEAGRVGMVVDVSHLTDPGFYDVAEFSDGPFVATHSNARSICSFPRNLTDEQIKILADKGGVMGINFCRAFINDDPEKADLDDVVRHYERIVEIGGPDAVALGTDYDGIHAGPDGLDDVSTLPKLTDALLSRGVSDEDVRKFLGENWMRVFEQVWK